MIILGCGYVGTELARQALTMGESVAALTRNPARAASLRALGVSPVVVGDLAAGDWHEALNPADATIVNCVSPAGSGPEGYRHSFIGGTRSIALWLQKSAAAGHPPARAALFTSSTGVYPQTDGEWVNETSEYNPAALSASGAILREAEQMWFALPTQNGLRRWVLRLGGLYGPGRHQLLDTLLLDGEKYFPGNGEHWLNLLYRDDAASAILACLKASPEISGGIFNAVDDEPVRKRELVSWLAERLGQNPGELHFDAKISHRSEHRRTASGQSPNRRIANLYLKSTLPWVPLCPSYRDGYARILAQKTT